MTVLVITEVGWPLVTNGHTNLLAGWRQIHTGMIMS